MARHLPALRRSVASALVSIAITSVPLEAQTPEQRYTDWGRPDFRPQEYSYRRSHMLGLLVESGGGVMLVPSSDGGTHGETFRQLDDFWYFTGLEVPGSMLALDADAGQAILFLPARDARFENPGRANDFPGRPLLSDYELRGITGADQYRDVAELGDYLSARVSAGVALRVNAGRAGGVEVAWPPLIGRLDPWQSLVAGLRRDHPDAELRNAFADVARIRMVKSPAEIRRLRVSAEATAAAIRATARSVRAGVDERTLQGAFESTCRALGAQAIPFTPIVKSGPNSLWPWRILAAHYDRRNRAMADGELVILDVGCEVDGYVSDVGRTFPVSGSFSELQREKLAVSTGAADAIIAAIRPGITFAELTRVAYEAIPDAEEGYMQTPSFFGHHIGLSSGDPALPGAPLEAGMVFTVEPWYYNHDLGISVFVEDVVLVTEEGAEVLTSALGRTPEQLEAMMR